MDESNKRSRLGWILVIIGALLLLRNFDLIPSIPSYIWSWQVILIIIGSVLLVSNKNKSSGITLIVIGTFFLIPEVLGISWREFRTYWPVLLVVLGIIFILGRRSNNSPGGVSKMDMIDELAVLGGGDRFITSENFQGGKITTVLGGMDLDMREAKLAEGSHVLDVFTMFGGVDIKVPQDWEIKVSVVSILGGFGDDRVNAKEAVNSTRKLEIKGFTMFGGGSVKS